MPSSFAPGPLERAQPWLGTRVAIRVDRWWPGCDVQAAVSEAFNEVATIHHLMSFRAADSDVARLNRSAHRRAVPIDRRTMAVIQAAQMLSHACDGVFDVTLAGRWVAAGLLPPPAGSPPADPTASYRDVQVEDDGVRFLKPLWIDLGGIAKGFAADSAARVLRLHGVWEGRVDAGGDLVTIGPGPHRIVLRAGAGSPDTAAVVEIGEGAVATSSHRGDVRRRNGLAAIAHWHGQQRMPLSSSCSVSVLATEGLHADALTKVVLASGSAALPLLAHYGAVAYRHDELGGWHPLQASA
ncbi:FAD:protein FMN transferase [Dyella kyungheensis]|uniref:FAD:protein FMN transferase n=1 Tax=Dyella kyungheensis TaxID=1242174 RepID=A0ABS2JR97_9GAMM|nr:FAD:protein FMN transferase [Dyella kyungheensis]MBM7120790.1 FAD:protein FMN transferase [Dyella kyungheensis]